MRQLAVLVGVVAQFGFVTGAAAEGIPRQLSYQGRLLDSSGQPVQGTRKLGFEVFDAAVGGASLWSDTLENVGVVDGYYEIVLGSTPGHAFPASLFDGSARYLEISVEGAKLSPRQAIGSVPFALKAQELANGKAPLFVEAETSAPAQGIGAAVADPTASGGMRYTVLASSAAGGRAWGMHNGELAKLGIGSWGMQAQAVTARIKVTNNLSTAVLATFNCTAKRGGTWVPLASINIVPESLPPNQWTSVWINCGWSPDDVDSFVGFDGFVTGITDLSIDWVESVRQHTGFVSGYIQPPNWSYSATGPVTEWKALWAGTAFFPSDSLVTLSLMGHWMVDKPGCYATILVDGTPLSSAGSSAVGSWGASLTYSTTWGPIGFTAPTVVSAGRHAFSAAVLPIDGTTCTVNGARIYYGAVAR
jgi:hypothetical protein